MGLRDLVEADAGRLLARDFAVAVAWRGAGGTAAAVTVVASVAQQARSAVADELGLSDRVDAVAVVRRAQVAVPTVGDRITPAAGELAGVELVVVRWTSDAACHRLELQREEERRRAAEGRREELR